MVVLEKSNLIVTQIKNLIYSQNYDTLAMQVRTISRVNAPKQKAFRDQNTGSP